MRIHAVAMVKNEADIIEAFVRHNLRFVDALTVLVHGATDTTVDILRALVQEGLPLQLQHDHATGYAQQARMTLLARNAFAAGADFVFPLDADEMLDAPSRATIEEALASIDPGEPSRIYLMRHYVPRGSDPSDEINPIRRMRYRLPDVHNIVGKIVLTRSFAAGLQFEIDMGNHGLLWRTGPVITQLPPPKLLPGLGLAHYPVRSAAQFANKVIVGYLAYIAVGYPPEFEKKNAVHWRIWYETLLADPSLLDQDFAALAAKYHKISADTNLVLEPLPCEFDLRYPPVQSNAPLAVLARFTEQLIRNQQTPASS